MIMSEWKEVKIGDVCSVKRGASPRPIQNFMCKNGMPWVKIADATRSNSRYINSTEEFIIKEGVLKSRTVTPGTLIVSNSATPGLPKIMGITGCVHDGWLIIDDFNGVLKEYMYYKFIDIRRVLSNQANGSVFMNLKTDIVKSFPIHIPTIEEQAKIVSFLENIDSKIECNQNICANLEAQAQALFKHWFIDFAPFKDGKFVESELGMIPERWRVGTYSDIIKDTISGDWGKDSSVGNYNHKVACIRGCDFQDVKMGLRGKTPERFILEKNFQSKHFENKDVLVEISGGTATVSTGRVCPVSQLLIDKYNGDVVCTNFCKLIRPIEGYSSYLYYSWKYKYDRKVMFGYENGTSGIKNFSIQDFTTREPLVLPTLTALNEFEGIIDHIHTQIQNCGSESSKLAVIRDTLLPKLMSGEIKV